MKCFFSDVNPNIVELNSFIRKNPESYIYPLIKNLNKANAEILKDILLSENEKLQKIQLCVFDYLLFHLLTEEFDPTNLEEKFENAKDIFRYL